MFGHQWHFHWQAGDGPILVVFGSTHQLKKNIVKADPSGSAHAI